MLPDQGCIGVSAWDVAQGQRGFRLPAASAWCKARHTAPQPLGGLSWHEQSANDGKPVASQREGQRKRVAVQKLVEPDQFLATFGTPGTDQAKRCTYHDGRNDQICVGNDLSLKETLLQKCTGQGAKSCTQQSIDKAFTDDSIWGAACQVTTSS